MKSPDRSGRATILSRIREALSVPTDPDVKQVAFHRHGSGPSPDPAPESGARPWLLAGGDTPEDRLAHFAAFCQKLNTRLEVVGSLAVACAMVRSIATAEVWRRIAAHHHEGLDAVLATLSLPVLFTDQDYDRTELEQCDAGLTTCDALIAQTGSVLVTSQSSGGRVLSVLPPHHVVLATSDQLVSDLAAAFARLRMKYGTTFPSLISFITGPSRTGDIERILVLGAHGPKRLTVILVEPGAESRT